MKDLDKDSLQRGITRDLAIAMKRETVEAFRAHAWNGQQWKPHKEKGMQDLLYGGKGSGGLSSSIDFSVEGGEVVVYCPLPYANIHNDEG